MKAEICMFLVLSSFSAFGKDKDNTPVLIADKTLGEISVFYPETGETKVSPALFGSVKSDKLDMNVYDGNVRANHITPAGTYKLEQVFSHRLNEPMLVFIRGRTKIAAIHPLWLVTPDKKRPQRLKSATPDDNRITNGCINVDPNFFYGVLAKIPDGAILNIKPELN